MPFEKRFVERTKFQTQDNYSKVEMAKTTKNEGKHCARDQERTCYLF